jgi:hypothetical protein
VGTADDVVAIMLKGREEEETLVLERELFVLAVAAEDQQLFALRKCTDCDGPLFDCDWHLQLLEENLDVSGVIASKQGKILNESITNYRANLKFPC